MPEISVIIPYYNEDPEILKACINSILSQSFQDFEIIIVDDGSILENRKSISVLESLDSRIAVISQANSGVSVARNNGVNISKGRYLVFVDADDMTLPFYLEEALNVAKTTGADIVYGLARRTRDASTLDEKKEKPPIRCVDNEWLKQYMVGAVYGNDDIYLGRGPWARLIKAEIAKKVAFPANVPIGEDVLWNLEIAKQTEKMYLVDQIWYHYMVRDNSITIKYNPQIEEKVLPFYDHIERYLTDSDNDRRWYYNRIFGDLRRYIFDAYLGNSKNKDSLLRRWRQFCRFCKHMPWKKLSDLTYFRVANCKEKFKVIMFRTRMIFFAWYFK